MHTSTFAIVAVLALEVLLATAEQAQPPASQGPVSLASLKPPILTVSLNFNISGTVSPADTSCTTDVLGAPCLQKLQAARDAVLIHYSVLGSAILPRTATNVSLAACYSNFSQIDRPWRKAAPTLDLDKSCPFAILPAPGKPSFSPLGGNATWKVPGNVPAGTYYIRALLQCKTPAGLRPCGLGLSLPGFFQVNKINVRPGGLVAGTIAGCLLGPLSLLGYFVYERSFRPSS